LIPSSGLGRCGFLWGVGLAVGLGFFASYFADFLSAATTAQLSKITSEKAAKALTIPARPLRNGSMNSF